MFRPVACRLKRSNSENPHDPPSHSLCLVSPPLLGLSTPIHFATLVAQQARPATALDTAGMDRSVKPGDNFFDYANGTWLKTTEIPADRSSYGAGAMLTDLTDRRVADLIQEAAKAKAPAGSDLRKIGDYYASFMDTTAIEAAGLEPLQPKLDSIAAIRDRKDLAARARVHAPGRRGRVSTTPISTPRTCSASGSRRTWMIRRGTRRSCSRAGWPCPTGATTSIRRLRWRRSAPSIRSTSRRCSDGPHRRRRRQGRRSSRLEAGAGAGGEDGPCGGDPANANFAAAGGIDGSSATDAVRRVHADSGSRGKGPADPGRKHRRPGRSDRELRRLPPVAAGHAGPLGAEVHRRPASSS